MAVLYKYLDSFLDEQRANGKYTFATDGLHNHLGVSENALNQTLHRLKKKGSIAMVRKGFYAIVPPEYKSKGIIPTSLYVHDMMKFLNRNYYVGLLNAASFHGAAHQQPQSFTIITEGVALRPIKNDKVYIHFYHKRRWNKNSIVQHKVDTGYINISSPELTALDLINYYDHVGGFNRIATVIEELKDVMRTENLNQTAKHYGETTVVQRLGYILEHILHETELSKCLYEYLKSIEFYPTLLRPQKNKPDTMRSGNKWKIVVNIEIEPDI